MGALASCLSLSPLSFEVLKNRIEHVNVQTTKIKRSPYQRKYKIMFAAFVRFVIAFLALIGLTFYTMTVTLPAGSTLGMWLTLLIAVPAVAYTWSTFARKCLTPQTRQKSPMLYSLGMFFGVPQKTLGLICFLIGLSLIYSYLSGGVILSVITVVFSYGLMLFGLTWLFNFAFISLREKK